MVETVFEQHGCPAIFLAKNAVLSSFATGRQTSLVMDAGHEGTVGEPLDPVSVGFEEVLGTAEAACDCTTYPLPIKLTKY